MPFREPADIIDFIANEDVKFVDIRFTDLPGTEQHFTIPASEFDETTMSEGLAFDGSSTVSYTHLTLPTTPYV